MTADEIVGLLELRPHPEGGSFVETYRSTFVLPPSCLPVGYPGDRNLATGIYYMLRKGTVSALHRVTGTELFHFYLGSPVEQLQLHPDGSGKVVVIGADLAAGMRPQVVVHGGTWQGARLQGDGEFALLGTTMAPGFDYADFELGDRDQLIARYPAFADLIAELTP